jgi:beta-1,2-mannobiose phosphorylase / 1,2-beta-oligomannan phosphorylase
VTVHLARPASRSAPGLRELFTRSPANPLLTAADWPYPVNSVFNPGAAVVDGETVLLCRVEDRRGISHLTVARSHDGVSGWRIEPEPLLAGDPNDNTVRWGVEDPRITRIDEMDGWLVSYTATGPAGPCVALAVTQDFRSVERIGVVMPPEDKDAALLARHIGGQFVLIHRPVSRLSGRADIWLSRSHDLRAWTTPELVLAARPGVWWDSVRIGMGPPPLETPYGWLGFYHGVKQVGAGLVYRVGLVLLDLENPAVVRHRSDEWVLGPTVEYEVAGNAPNVVFPTGLVHDPAGDELRMYYGAADCAVALATARMSEVLEYAVSCPPVEPDRPW